MRVFWFYFLEDSVLETLLAAWLEFLKDWPKIDNFQIAISEKTFLWNTFLGCFCIKVCLYSLVYRITLLWRLRQVMPVIQRNKLQNLLSIKKTLEWNK